jgi:NitT/TauT family transport system substrate-binding protein
MKGKGILALAIVSILVVAGLVSAFVLWNSAESEMELTITYSNKVDYEPFIVAEELGYFEEEDLNVTTLVVSGGIQSAEAIMTGAADVGAMGDAPATQLLDKNTDAMIVCRYSGGEGMHRYIAQEDILTPKDLEGKKVGIQMGSSTHGSFMQWADANGISMSDVTLVPMNPADMPSAMETGQIDAMAGSEPWPTNVEKVCGEKVHEIGTSKDLGNTFPMLMMASGKAVDEKPEAIKAAVRAIERAVDYINLNYEESAAICANHTGLTMQEQMRCMDSLFFEVGFDQSDLESLNQTAGFLLENDKISAIPDFAGKLVTEDDPRSDQVRLVRTEE